MDTSPVSKPGMSTSRVFMTTLVVFLFIVSRGSCQRARTGEAYREEAKQVYSSMFHNYNPLVQPNNQLPDPMEVRLNGSIVHLRSLNVRKQEMTSLLDLYISWEDSRLAWFVVQVAKVSVNISSIWRPEFVYRNSAAPPQTLSSGHVVVDYKGRVLWHRRDLVTTICRTQPGNSSQVCVITLGLNSLTNIPVIFDNTTELSLDPDFMNHEWHVEKAMMEEEGMDTIHFILEVRPKDGLPLLLGAQDEEDSSSSACANDVTYSVNGADAVAGGHVVKMASFPLLVVVWLSLLCAGTAVTSGAPSCGL